MWGYRMERRQVLGAGMAAGIAAGGLGLVGLLAPSGASAAEQGAWRFCRKCSTLFFDGYLSKGACAAGGSHEASGLVFLLPHSLPETPKSQSQWRYCGKCMAMFFDGFPHKGACPRGGGHGASGLVFQLPHDIPETPVAQGRWRYCGRCSAMFFDGYPQKGRCPQGGGHQAAGFQFVLPHETDYVDKMTKLSRPDGPLKQVLKEAWDRAGRAIMAERVQQAINGHVFREGVGGTRAHASIGDIDGTWAQRGPNLLHVSLQVPRSNVDFKTTTPTVLGSYADPEFRVGFSLVVDFDLAVAPARRPVTIAAVNARATNADIHGSNITGTLVETVGDFLTHGSFSRNITDQINQNARLRADLASAIDDAIDRVWI